MADKDPRPAVTPKADRGGRVEDRICNARDSLPGMRDALPKGCAWQRADRPTRRREPRTADRRTNVTATVAAFSGRGGRPPPPPAGAIRPRRFANRLKPERASPRQSPRPPAG